MQKKHLRAAILGFLFGAITPFVGVFLGLQISPFLGTLFAFPFLAAGWMFGEPFGSLSPLIKVGALLLSGLVWSFIFLSTAKALSRRSQQQ